MFDLLNLVMNVDGRTILEDNEVNKFERSKEFTLREIKLGV